ncbi:MAG: hypothetical protein DI585_03055 [Pseudomonas fluorescens]|nr:MAG: hypothetical protein DI585_03055 [Pseudomonas fluorescens]
MPLRPSRPIPVVLNALHATTGGGLTYLRGILPELAKEARVRWIVLAPQAALEGMEIPANVDVKVAPVLGFAAGHMWEQFVLPFKALGWGAKTIVCNANYTPLLAWRSIPILHTTPKAGASAQSARMRWYWSVLERLTKLSLWNAPYAFAVAKHVVREYLGEAAAAKVKMVPPGVDAALADVPVRDPNLVVAVGDFYAHKDYPQLVRAFGMLRAQRPESRLMIIGRPVDVAVRNEVLNLIRELKLADAVTLTGGMPHTLLLQAVARASVFVSTSKAETVQIPALEAMAVGTPVVTSDLPHGEEFVGAAGVLVPVGKGGDVDSAFAVAMYGVLENEALANGLRAKGLERVKSYTWTKAAATLNAAVLGER